MDSNRSLPIWALLVLGGCSTTTTERLGLEPLTTVPRVDLERYIGTWYEIASFPQRFQKGCHGTTATYRMDPGGDIAVINRCHDGAPDGPVRIAEGRARVIDPTTNAKLEVSFFRPFWGDYWIIDLDESYGWAVVGHPSRDYLWILSRTPSMSPQLYDGIIERLEAQGYETGRLEPTL